eukprot:PhF_6_TR37186/c0_g1_i1/m.54791/K05940/CROT; carnitine O-octanoyltransferase
MQIRRVQGAKTFANDESLPSLPVPPLEQTLKRLEESVQLVCTNDTEKQQLHALIAEALASPEVQKAHSLLQKRGSEQRNWLEGIWEKVAYLDARYPTYINTNIFSFRDSDFLEDGKPKPMVSDPVVRAALGIDEMNWLRSKLANETFPQEFMGKLPLCMSQYAKYFTTRIPQVGMDTLVTTPPAEARNVILMVDPGVMFNLDVEGLTTQQITDLVAYCQEKAREYVRVNPAFPRIGVLTTADRDVWATARNELLSSHPDHQKYFDLISQSMIILSLDQKTISTYDEAIVYASHENYWNRFYDKTYQMIISANAVVLTNADHSPLDAIVVAGLSVDDCLEYLAKRPKDTIPSGGVAANAKQDRVLLFEWKAPTSVLDAIAKTIPVTEQMIRDNEVCVLRFNKFGKKALMQAQISTDAFVQMCLQISYNRDQGGAIAPVYESGMTRTFYHGRTETIRALTRDAITFVKDFVGKREKVKELFASAAKQHSVVSAHSVRGNGIDRHLLGLRVMASIGGIQLPALFSSPLVQRSSTWLLSTSQMMGSGVVG